MDILHKLLRRSNILGFLQFVTYTHCVGVCLVVCRLIWESVCAWMFVWVRKRMFVSGVVCGCGYLCVWMLCRCLWMWMSLFNICGCWCLTWRCSYVCSCICRSISQCVCKRTHVSTIVLLYVYTRKVYLSTYIDLVYTCDYAYLHTWWWRR